MPFASIGPDLRLFYNIYSPNGEQIDHSRQTILLLHPRLFDHELMSPQYNEDRLRKHYNMVAVDHHYHGKSEVPVDDEPYDHKRIGQDLLHLLRLLDVKTFHIFGSAMGAMIGLYMATLDPSRIISLTLCGLPAPVDAPELLEHYRKVVELASHADEEGKDELPSDMISSGKLVYFNNRWPEDEFEKWAAATKFRPSNRPLIVKVYSSTIDRKPLAPVDWKKVTMPVLLIHGSKDLLYPPVAAHQSYKCLSEASQKELHIIEGGPHLLSIIDAKKVNDLFVPFLQKRL